MVRPNRRMDMKEKILDRTIAWLLLSIFLIVTFSVSMDIQKKVYVIKTLISDTKDINARLRKMENTLPKLDVRKRQLR